MMRHEHEAGVVAEALAGKDDAIAALYERYFPRLKRHCRRYVGSAQEAEDVAQDAFLRALRYLPSFDATRPLWPWLKRIGTSTSLNHIDERRRWSALPDG